MGVRWGPRAILLAVAFGISLLPAAPAGAAVRSEFFGIVQGGTPGTRDLKGLTKARIRSDRFMLNWGWVQPRSAGSFKWSGPDRVIGALASRGIRAVPVLWGNPGWAYGSPARPPLDRPSDALAWRSFLRATVARYGPGGTYWATRYRRQYGAKAAPLPIASWQIWNEPNLGKFFAPYPSPGRYAQLLRISHDAIKGVDPKAQIVLAGMPGYGDVTAWRFLHGVYSVPGIGRYFDAAALHPYARDLGHHKRQIQRFRSVMRNHGDAGTPLWISELAWGSAPPDGFGINKGPAGQAQLLRGAFELILSHRAAWNVQRVFWYHWRDPRRSQANCSFCGSAGLVTSKHVPKPAHAAFLRFSAERTPPRTTIAAGPPQGAVIANPRPIFRFRSSEAGSTFECHFDARAYSRCPPRFRARRPLANGNHRLFVRAVDVAGNVSAVAARSFKVDTIPPRVTISSGPATGSSSSNARPSFGFAANEPHVTFRCRLDSGAARPCQPPFATGPLAGGRHSFAVTATDRAGNVGPPATRTWTIDSDAPTVRILSGPRSGSITSDPTPSFRFTSSDAGSRFRCRLDWRGFVPCASPRTPGPLLDGRHVFAVRAIDRARNQGLPLQVRFTVDTAAPRLRIKGPRKVTTSGRTASAAFALVASERVGRWCRIATQRFRPCTSRYRTPRLGDGPYTLAVKASDRAGNLVVRRKRFRVVRVTDEAPGEPPAERRGNGGTSNGGVAAGD
jgi:hypothetical protein